MKIKRLKAVLIFKDCMQYGSNSNLILKKISDQLERNIYEFFYVQFNSILKGYNLCKHILLLCIIIHFNNSALARDI